MKILARVGVDGSNTNDARAAAPRQLIMSLLSPVTIRNDAQNGRRKQNRPKSRRYIIASTLASITSSTAPTTKATGARTPIQQTRAATIKPRPLPRVPQRLTSQPRLVKTRRGLLTLLAMMASPKEKVGKMRRASLGCRQRWRGAYCGRGQLISVGPARRCLRF